VQVTANVGHDGQAQRATLFGSTAAFNDTSHYAMAVVQV